MKNLIILSIGLFGFTMAAKAQHSDIRLNGYAVGAFSDKVDSYYSSTDYFNGQVNGGLQWGGGIEIKPNKMMGVEFLYNRLDTKANLDYFNSSNSRPQNGTFTTAINNYMLGINRYFVSNAQTEAYGGILLGVTAGKVGSQSTTKFGYGFRLGGNFWVSPKVGIKLQAQLMSASQAVGGGFYFGTGGGGVGVSSYSSFYQFGLGGGLAFKLGK